MLSCGTSFSVALPKFSQLLVVCMHVCEHTTSHHFNAEIALNISVALVPCILAEMPSNNLLKVKANWPCPQTAQIRGLSIEMENMFDDDTQLL